ncbi:alpha/beta hydrolase [Halopseudomonas oceani]|uniref:Alpha/beta hydrolase n=1 Tax=Halopseudomonas oceani TaxID=1708783 RepID=A0A2P4EUW8_9GAMM|nr:alpha/beta fold hydrolase [Halopseudomonas oceani]POB03390.1 alpha/beta hydrolase [Halopseudomonas oceani]GGE43985.1 alpha/beta hydrolase [Halopseudomonas oceani]
MNYLFSFLLIALLLGIAGLYLYTLFIAKRVELGLPPEGSFVTVMGNRIHYIEQGSGPDTILLIHGLSGVAQNFGYGVIDALAKTHRVVAIDRPGSGYSERPARSSASLAVQADVVAGVIDALQLGKPLLVGHSLGGAVSLATALRHPDKVRGLALVAPLTHMPSKISDAFNGFAIRQPWLRTLVGWTLAVPMSIRKREQIMDIVFGPETVPADFPMRGGGFLGLRPSHFIAASTDMNALEAVLPLMQLRYDDLQLPIGVLYGRQDRILDPAEQGQALADRLSVVELELVDGGHMLPVTQPEITIDFILRQLQRQQAA